MHQADGGRRPVLTSSLLQSFNGVPGPGSLLLFAAAVSGCSATVRQQIYAPVVGAADAEFGRQFRDHVEFDLQDVQVHIYPVEISERMTVLYGPVLVVPTPSSEERILRERLEIRVNGRCAAMAPALWRTDDA